MQTQLKSWEVTSKCQQSGQVWRGVLEAARGSRRAYTFVCNPHTREHGGAFQDSRHAEAGADAALRLANPADIDDQSGKITLHPEYAFPPGWIEIGGSNQV